MRLPTDRVQLTTKRLVLVGAFLVVAGFTTVLFAQAVTGHHASMHAPSTDVTITDYEVTDDGLDVTLRVQNPTMKELTLVSSRVRATVDGELVTVATRTILDGVVGPGETKTLTVRLDFRDGGAERFRNAGSDRIEMEGSIKIQIVEEDITVPVDGMEGSA